LSVMLGWNAIKPIQLVNIALTMEAVNPECVLKRILRF
jgi:hypothetical protein